MGRRSTTSAQKALDDLQRFEVLMLDGHFDYGNGYHGRVYLNPHQLFRYPSTIWRFAQDLLDAAAGVDRRQTPTSSPARSTGGALLAHTIAGLLDSRRSLTHPPVLFAPFTPDGGRGLTLQSFYRAQIAGQARAARRRRAEHGPDVRAVRRRWCARPAAP